MIVYTGDWVKVSGMWKQVVSINYDMDSFATIDSDGANQWWGTNVPQVFDDHVSNAQMQDKLREAGL
jgi:hypothetical protein